MIYINLDQYFVGCIIGIVAILLIIYLIEFCWGLFVRLVNYIIDNKGKNKIKKN